MISAITLQNSQMYAYKRHHHCGKVQVGSYTTILALIFNHIASAEGDS